MVERYTHINVSHLASGQAKIWGNGGDVAEMKVATTNPVKA
jgi:hypothetical protein